MTEEERQRMLEMIRAKDRDYSEPTDPAASRVSAVASAIQKRRGDFGAVAGHMSQGARFGDLSAGGPGADPNAGSVDVSVGEPTIVSRTPMTRPAEQATPSPDFVAAIDRPAANPETPDAPIASDTSSIPSQVRRLMTGAATGAAMPAVQPAVQPSPDPTYDERRARQELYDAQEADRRSHLTAGMELAARQFVGGITRTPVGEGIGAAASQVPGVQHTQDQRRKAVADAIARRRQGMMDDSEMALRASEVAKNNQPPADKTDLESVKANLKVAYPNDVANIERLGSTKAAEDYRLINEGRLGRETTIKAASAQASANAANSFANHKAEKLFDDAMPKNVPPSMIEEKTALDSSDSIISRYKEQANKVSGWRAKVGATLPSVAGTGVLGEDAAQGATFDAQRHLSAIGLARSVEGGMAKPGTIEAIEKVLYLPNDSESVKAEKSRQLRELIADKKKIQAENLRLGNYKPMGGPPAASPVAATRPSPGPSYRRFTVDGRAGWYSSARNDWEPD